MKNRILHTLSGTTVTVGLLVGTTTAWAQNNNIIVDMSVLSGGLYSTDPSASQNGGLLMPDASMPRSSYFGPPVTVSNPLPVVTAPVVTAPVATTPASSTTLSNADNVPPPPPAPEPEVMPTVPEAPTETAMSEPEPPEPMEISVTEAAPEPMEITVEATEDTADTMTSDTMSSDTMASDIMAPEMTAEAATETETETETIEIESAPPPPPEEITQIQETETAETMEQDAMETSGETEMAAVTVDDAKAMPGRASQVLFAEGNVKLPETSKPNLDAVASAVSQDEGLRIQLMAYAGGDDLSSSKARRVSLSRALTVRSYLIKQGVRSTRIDVRALGDKNPDESQPINRVDVDITER